MKIFIQRLVNLFLINLLLIIGFPNSSNGQSCWHIITDLSWTGSGYPSGGSGEVFYAGDNLGIQPHFTPDAMTIWVRYGEDPNYTYPAQAVFEKSFTYNGGNRILFSYYTGDPEVYINGQLAYYPSMNLGSADLSAFIVNGPNTITIISHHSALEAEIYEVAPANPTIFATADAITYPCGTQSSIHLSVNTTFPSADWKWYSESCGGNYLGSGTSINVSPVQTTNYFALAEGGCYGAGACGSKEITVYPSTNPVSINIVSNNNPVCVGSATTFTASLTNAGGNPEYQWKVNGNNVGTNSSTYTTSSLNDNDEVSCSLINQACSFPVNSNVIIAYPHLTPTISITSNQNNICEGSSVFFEASATNVGNGSVYKWKKNGVIVRTYYASYPFQSDNYSDNNFVNGDIITCEITAAGLNCASTIPVVSNEIIMNVVPVNIPEVSIAITSGINPDCSGGPLTFTATPVHGGITPVYQWKFNGTNAGINSNTFSLPDPINGNVISCVMTSNENCANPITVTSNQITVHGPTTPQVYIYNTGNTGLNFCASETGTFYAYTYGEVPASYEWRLNGDVVGTNSATYIQTGFNANDQISCTITSNETCAIPVIATSNLLTISIYNPITASLTIAGSNSVCNGSLATFIATANNAGQNPTYYWTKNGLSVGINDYFYEDNTIISGDIISCSISTDAACGLPVTVQSSNSITMNVIELITPTITITASNSFLFTSNIFTSAITNGGNSPSYNWQINDTDVGVNSPSYPVSSLVNGDVISCILTSDAACATPQTVTSNPITFQQITYCEPDPLYGNTACTYWWISNVTMGSTINNPSACNGKYTDYTATDNDTLKTTAGSVISFTISENSGGTNYGASVGVFIDYNLDGDFVDVGEMIADNIYMDLTTNAEGTFLVPPGLPTGSYRIRIITDGVVNSPYCETFLGEVEDYTMTIEAGIVNWYLDTDADGYYTSGPIASVESPGEGYVTVVLGSNDCDSLNTNSWRSEILYIDNDHDGYTTFSESVCYGLTIPDGYALVQNGNDCNDFDNSQWHSALLYIDGDGDGLNIGSGTTICYGSTITGYTTTYGGGDCNDADPLNTITNGNALPLIEGFENLNNPVPSGWFNIDNQTENKKWALTNTTGGFGLSDSCMKFDNFNYSVRGEKDEFQLKQLDFSGLTAATLTFDVAYKVYTGYSDSLIVRVSTNCGNTFTRVYAQGGAGLSTAGSGGLFIPNPSQWRTETVDLSAYAGSTDVIVQFQNINDFGNNLYVDNINVTGVSVTCIYPTLPTFNTIIGPNCGIQNTNLSISGGSLNDATNWKWHSDSCNGPVVGSGTSINVSPSVTTTYFVRGEGGCVNSGMCNSITVSVNQPNIWYADADIDLFGNSSIHVLSCSPISGYVTDNTDCNDGNNLIFPGAMEVCGNLIDDNCDGQTDENCGGSVTLNLKVFIQGLYIGSGSMSSVLSNAGISTIANECDSIIIELHDAQTFALIGESKTVLLHTDGTANTLFPSSLSSNSYYIVVRHRNSIETWSEDPVLFSGNPVSFDFTTH
jgi:hypothetical protein